MLDTRFQWAYQQVLFQLFQEQERDKERRVVGALIRLLNLTNWPKLGLEDCAFSNRDFSTISYAYDSNENVQTKAAPSPNLAPNKAARTTCAYVQD